MKKNNVDSFEDKNLPDKEIVDLEKPFKDQRGEIQLVDAMMKSAL